LRVKKRIEDLKRLGTHTNRTPTYYIYTYKREQAKRASAYGNRVKN